MNIHILERHLALHEIHAHHHHSGDPEKDNIKPGYQHIPWIIAA